MKRIRSTGVWISTIIFFMFCVVGFSTDTKAAIFEDTLYYTVEEESDENDVYVTLHLIPRDAKYTDYEEADVYNYRCFSNALQLADREEKYKLHIKVERDSTYGGSSKIFEVGFSEGMPPTGTLRMRSNTEIDLNGYTLLATKDLIDTNFFGNCDMDGYKKSSEAGYKIAGGYNLTHDIAIKNGTIDGNAKSNSLANLITFGHVNGITVEDVTFTHNPANHLLEVNGCTNVEVLGCIFDGYLFKETSNDGSNYVSKEAFEIDIASAKHNWSNAYDGDDTVCSNIRVENCSFLDYPCGVGDHHEINGKQSSNIIIKNNTFTYSGSKMAECGMRTYAFDNCSIVGNTFNGNYFRPIAVYGGNNILIADNVVSKTKGDALTVTNSTVTKTSKKNYAKNVTITGNNFTATTRGMYISEKSSIKSISNNTVKVTDAKKGVGIAATKSTISKMKKNKITSSYKGVTITGGSVVSSVGENKITSGKDNALVVATKGRIGNLYGNTLVAKKRNAIVVSNSGSRISTCADNVITGYESGVVVSSSGVMKDVRLNQISSATKYAFLVSSKGKVTTLGGTPSGKNMITSDVKAGICVCGSGTVVDKISYNKIVTKNKKTGYGLFIYGGGKVKKIQSNTIASKGLKIKKI